MNMWPNEETIKEILNVTREEMRSCILERYENKFANNQILNLEKDCARQNDVNDIIRYLRLLNHSTYDFREAKKKIKVYELDRLTACYIKIRLKEMRDIRRQENHENAVKYVLDKNGCTTMDELKEKSGWKKDKNGILRCPKVERTKKLPDVLGKFNEVLYNGSKRIGYRGEKNEAREKYIKNRFWWEH